MVLLWSTLVRLYVVLMCYMNKNDLDNWCQYEQGIINELIFTRPLSDLPTTDMPSSFLTYEKNNNKKIFIIYKKKKAAAM